MTRRTSYKILEGDKENPKKMVAKVSSHDGRYGRVSLPKSLIGKVVEVFNPDPPLTVEAVGKGEAPEPSKRKPTETPSVSETSTSDTSTNDIGERSVSAG